MKKKLISAAFMVAIALTAGYNVYNSQNKVALSDLALDNVEALASGEVIVGRPCAVVPNSECIYFYPEYFETPGAFYN